MKRRTKRRTAVTVLAEEGCTGMQIAAITDRSLNEVSTILDKYMAMKWPLRHAPT